MADTGRARSRTPPRSAASTGAEAAVVGVWQVLPEAGLDVRESCSWSAEVLGRKLRGTVVYGQQEAGGWVRLSDEPGFLPTQGEDGPVLRQAVAPAKPEAEEKEGSGEEETRAEDDGGAPAAPAEEAPAAPEPPKPFRCHGCELGFDTEPELRAHVRASAACSGEAWQAAVSAMACLPGAGTVLWCPACADASAGRWTGSATKAPVLLRHLTAGAKEGHPNAAQHARLWATLLALLSAEPPPRAEGGGQEEEGESLQEWALRSRLLEATGPLLAKPGPDARKAVRKLQDRMLGPDPDAPPGEEAEAEEGGGGEAPAKSARKAKKAPVAEGPSYSFYNDDIPMDVFSVCQDQTQRTTDGVPIMDLVSSDEEPAPSRGGLTEL